MRTLLEEIDELLSPGQVHGREAPQHCHNTCLLDSTQFRMRSGPPIKSWQFEECRAGRIAEDLGRSIALSGSSE